jgi:hypothetical protein
MRPYLVVREAFLVRHGIGEARCEVRVYGY